MLDKMIHFSLPLILTLLLGMFPYPDNPGIKPKDEKLEKLFFKLSAKADSERYREAVYYRSKDPLPRRVLNWSIPGHNLSSLQEADAWIIAKLSSNGYLPFTDSTRVRAYGRDFSKPAAHQYAKPPDDAPWFTARNIIAELKGEKDRKNLIVIIAHKDSQSWIASPGANDNASGTCGALELAVILRKYKPRHTIRFIWCNEEHTPWTSITAVENLKKEGLDVLAAINMDGIGVKSPEHAGLKKNVTRYSSPEGEKLADMMEYLNNRLDIGLGQSKYFSQRPNDDDGSFIKGGFPWAVLNIGSMPYADPEYHLESDSADKVDVENAILTVKLTLAAVLYLDLYGRP
jgi:hypothetical protein